MSYTMLSQALNTFDYILKHSLYTWVQLINLNVILLILLP